MADRGRGRLSGLDLLPEEAGPIIAWAASQLSDRSKTQQDIYEEFYSKLEALQVEYRGELDFVIPSKSAFNRYSIKHAAMTRRLEETRSIASSLAGRFDAQASDDLTIIAAEAIKTLIYETLTAAGEHGIDPKGTMALASALHKATQAQGVSTARRKTVESDFKGKVDQALAAVEKSAGASGTDVLRRIREDIYGIFTPDAEG